MKILVCVKQVVEIAGEIQMSHPSLKTDTSKKIQLNELSMDLDHHINYYDEFAVEEAVRLKERLPGVTIDALTVGPERAETTLRRALAMGVDHGIHIQAEEIELMPAEVTSRLIANYLSAHPYDLVLTGVVSEDLMQGLTGPMLAARCGLPCATAVIDLSLNDKGDFLEAACELEGGLTETIRLKLPALLSVQSGLNQPRYASLSNRLRARSQPLEIIQPDETALLPQSCTIKNLATPEKTSQGEMLSGNIEEKADRLMTIMHERSLI